MISADNIEQAAKALLERRLSTDKFSRLDESCRPSSLDDGLSIQSKMTELNGNAVGGWKCLLPPDTDKVVVAPIYSNTIFTGDTAKFYVDNNAARIEPEIVFILANDLPAQEQDYTNEEIDAAIGQSHMALELIQARYAADSGAEFPELLADGLSNQGLFIGPEIDKAKVYQAAEISIVITQGEESQTLAGKHPNPFPQLPIYWMVNYMSKRGISFKAGQAIITGSYAGVVDVTFAQTDVEYKGLGKYQVSLQQL